MAPAVSVPWRSVPWGRIFYLLTHSLQPGSVGFQSGYESEKHVHLPDFDVSTLVCMSPFAMLENEGLEDEVLPLALAALGMNTLVTLNSFGVYGNIIWSSVDIP